MTPTTITPVRNEGDFSSQELSQNCLTGQRGTPLSISTSRKSDGTFQSQSSTSSSSFAQPPSPHRIVSSPLPSPASPQYTTARHSTAPHTPRSAGYNDKSMEFRGSYKHGSKCPTTPSAKRRSDSLTLADKRSSLDPKSNVYTQCGRHSDQWLFGGFPFDNIKKALGSEK